MATKYYAVVVTYNSRVDEAETCHNLVGISGHDISIVIFDNSDQPSFTKHNQTVSEERGWTYITEGKNIGLSKAYNKVLDFLSDCDGVLIWFDDDSHVTQEYFDTLEASLSNGADIYAPVIQAQNGNFYSPNEAGYLMYKQLKNADDPVRNDKFNCINSCTAIKLEVFKDYRYDENLFLDQIDHDFCRSQRLRNKTFYKLPVIINHNFSLKNHMSSVAAVKRRYELLIPDFIKYCRKQGFIKSKLAYVKIFAWGVEQSLKYKDWSILTWMIKFSIGNK